MLQLIYFCVFTNTFVLIILNNQCLFWLRQKAYLKIACKQGWFVSPLCHPPSRYVFGLSLYDYLSSGHLSRSLFIFNSVFIPELVCMN